MLRNIFKSIIKQESEQPKREKINYLSFPLVEESKSLLEKYNNDIKTFKQIIFYEPEEVKEKYYELTNELLWTIHYLSDFKNMTETRYELLSSKYQLLSKQIDNIVYVSVMN